MKLSKLKCITAAMVAALLALATPAVAQEGANLEQAFQKEFAFLEAQKRDLLRRLAETKTEIENEQSDVMIEIDKLEMKLLDLETETERLSELVLASERTIETNQSNQEILAATYDQAGATLADYGVELMGDDEFVAAQSEGKLSQLFQMTVASLEQMSAVRQQPGSFFLAGGTQVDGQLIKVGNIAAYGISDQGAGVLAPAGEGELKLWGEPAAGVANALAAGSNPAELKIFLFESLKTGVEQLKQEGVLATINSGGIIGWTIVALGLLGVALIIARIVFLRRASLARGKIEKEVSELVGKGEVDRALAVCKQEQGATARVVASTLRNLDRDRDHLEDIISESILHESGTLNRFGAFILVIAAVSPLLGLLGTVTGMIATFDVITEFGTGDPKLLSGGISTALVTTELGLIVAIPVLVVGNLLSGWANRIKDEMEKAALHVTNQHLANRHLNDIAAAA